MKKGFFTKLQNSVTTKAKNVVKEFKKKHKLSGTSPKVTRIFEQGAWYRGKFLCQSLICLLVLMILITAMLLLKEESAKVMALMSDAVIIAGASALVFMQFTAGLMVWGTWKLLWLFCSYLWTYVAPVGALLIMFYGDVIQPVLHFLSGFLF